MEVPLHNLPWLILFQRLLASILCGALIGFEREQQRKPAGLRTMILICFGSTLYITVSLLASEGSEFPFDVTRVASQVVTGVGFLGAGAIIMGKGHVHGLTTAATIWTVAAIGLIIGLGYPLLGMAVTGFVLAILIILRKLRKGFLKRWIDEVDE
ncbi:hypothetical protein CEE37_08500 [candidate division LCP-89 bacterium B3_LCP]|uniref:MgtC/SapB/SrpB/YhiD N-terminal domain-containing protein n=1 Tax=candidate division LCP-89 bacterium B3_LCP TaxID=2012998 RepID=A0A532V067_UNCL8|nr:MAG: hypothetical protein CEE37_08500 [candidate division LCP-89 bacterium B3_LCP]